MEAEWSPDDELLFRPRYNAEPSDTQWILRHGADRRVIGSAVLGYRTVRHARQRFWLVGM
jgi:hypothetical protein